MDDILTIPSVIDGIEYEIKGRYVASDLKAFVLIVHGATPPTGPSNDAIMDFAFIQNILAINHIASFSYNSVGIGSTDQTKSLSLQEGANGYNEYSLANRITELHTLLAYIQKHYVIPEKFFILSVSMGNHIALRMIETDNLASKVCGYINLGGAVFLPDVETLPAYEDNDSQKTRSYILRHTTTDMLLCAPILSYLQQLQEDHALFPILSMYGIGSAMIEPDTVIPYVLQQRWKDFSATFVGVPNAGHPLITRSASDAVRTYVSDEILHFIATL